MVILLKMTKYATVSLRLQVVREGIFGIEI
jgi:hypothetical protein